MSQSVRDSGIGACPEADGEVMTTPAGHCAGRIARSAGRVVIPAFRVRQFSHSDDRHRVFAVLENDRIADRHHTLARHLDTDPCASPRGGGALRYHPPVAAGTPRPPSDENSAGLLHTSKVFFRIVCCRPNNVFSLGQTDEHCYHDSHLKHPAQSWT